MYHPGCMNCLEAVIHLCDWLKTFDPLACIGLMEYAHKMEWIDNRGYFALQGYILGNPYCEIGRW